MDPLAAKQEFALTGQHANTHLPEIIGVARGWELTGNSTLADITTFFYDILTKHYTYSATGGSNQGEHWLYPDMLGTAIATHPGGDSAGYHTEESCTQYNVLKVARHLYTWSADSALFDFYERAVLNGILGNQNRLDPAVTSFICARSGRLISTALHMPLRFCSHRTVA